MKNLTNIISESYDSVTLLQDELNEYAKRMSSKLPKNVQSALYLLNKYPKINTKEMVMDIMNGKKIDVDVDAQTLKDLQKILKKLGDDIKLLPQCMTKVQRELLQDGKLAQDDLTMDLDSDRGRNAVAKQYGPLVFKIVNQFVGKSALGKDDLLGAGLEGLTKAMNDYRKPNDNGEVPSMSFGQYASYRIRQSILDELNYNSRNIHISHYFQKQLKNAGDSTSKEVSLDNFFNNDNDGENAIDKISNIGVDPDYTLSKNDEKLWAKVFASLEKKFTERECNIFYRTFGINGQKKEKGKDIAKDLHVSAPAITQVIKKILNFIKKDKDSLEVMRDILTIYTESLIVDLYYKSKDEIVEALLNDDLFLMLEELNRWSDKDAFVNAISSSLNEMNEEKSKEIYSSIKEGLGDEDYLTLEEKRLYISFLNNLYPTNNFSRKSNIEIVESINELNELYIKHKINW